MTAIEQAIIALERANMMLTSLGANNTVFCTEAIEALRKMNNADNQPRE